MKALRSILAGSAVAAFAMTSCTADEQISQNTTDGAIRFSVNTANQTRAAHSYCANEMPAYFKVYADYTGEDNAKKLYIDGDQLNRVGATTTYLSENNRYWPVTEGFKLNFYAYVDADNTFNYNNGSPRFENFIVKGAEVENASVVEEDAEVSARETVADQLDLMYAVKTNATKEDGAVALNFRHALSQICFKAINENEKITIIVNSVSISGVVGKGSYNFPLKDTNTQYENHTDEPLEGETPELFRGDWYNLSKDNIKTYKVPIDSWNGYINNTNQVYDLTGFDTHESGVDKPYESVLNLIPQNSEKLSIDQDKLFFTLNLTIKNKAKRPNNNQDVTTIIENGDFKVPASFAWTEGNRYIYTFKFNKNWNPDELNTITYDVTVDDFIPTTSIPIPDQSEIKYKKWQMRKEQGTPGAEGYIAPLYVADRNIGAVNPEDPGMYFAWGSTTGYYYKGDNLVAEDGSIVCNGPDVGMKYFYEGNETSPYFFCNKSLSELFNTNYLTSETKWEENTETVQTNYATLTENYDAATQKMGESWRMMTTEDIKWLIEYCNWDWVNEDGFKGFEVTPKDEDLKDSKIRIPASSDLYGGVKSYPTEARPGGTYYWSSVPYERVFSENDIDKEDAYYLEFSHESESPKPDLDTYYARFFGFLVRGVSNSGD